MAAVTNEFGYRTDELKGGKTPAEIVKAYRGDPEFRNTANKLTYEFAVNHNKTKVEMLRLSGTTASLNSVSGSTKETLAQK